MKTKWCIALENIGPYTDPVLGERYKFLKGERATKDKVFSMMPDMTEEEYAKCFRPATEEEINGKFEWDGEQYVLKKEITMTTIDYKQKIKDYMNSSEVDTLYKSMLNNLFPELAESKDERIRKHLIGVVELYYGNTDEQEKKDCLAWLEKQGEKKSDNKADSIIYSYITPNPEFFQWIYDRLINVHNENPSVDYMLSLKKRIEDMQNPINDDMKEALQTEYEKGRADAIAEMQKTWSEEDEVNLNEALSYIKDDALKEFIKSLKDRVQPQPKQEWSEEDEEEANYIADFIENLIKKEKLVSKKTMVMEEMVAWLRDIKYRYLPKPEQGWSEEDERIRKWLISTLKSLNSSPVQIDDAYEMMLPAIAWLEKQGETFTKKYVDDAYLKGVTDTKNEIKKQYEETYQIRKDIATFILNYKGDIKDRAKWIDYLGIKVSFVEKQGKQILANSAKTCKDEQKPEVDQHSLPVSDNSSLPTFDECIYHPCTEKAYEQKFAEWSEVDDEHLERILKELESQR